MPTPSIQTLVTDAQQILNLDSISAVRSVVAVALANANTGTPLNPNLTTQQLWNEFYQVVNKPKSDIESIIANQLMKFLFAPPAPGGVGANGQVIFNDGGVLAGDPQFLWNKTTNLLTITGSATITGDLTVRTTGLTVNSSGVGVGLTAALGAGNIQIAAGKYLGYSASAYITPEDNVQGARIKADNILIDGNTSTKWNIGGSEAMRLNSTGLGVGVTPSAWASGNKFIDINSSAAFGAFGSSDAMMIGNAYWNGSSWIRKTANNAWRFVIESVSSTPTMTWQLAANGSAGSSISSWTQAMTLDASGNLLVGTTSSPSGTKVGAITKLSSVSLEGTASINVSTTPVALSRATGNSGLYFVQGYNTSGGAQGWWLVASNGGATPTVIANGNSTGLTVTFTMVAGALNMNTASGTIAATAFNITA